MYRFLAENFQVVKSISIAQHGNRKKQSKIQMVKEKATTSDLYYEILCLFSVVFMVPHYGLGMEREVVELGNEDDNFVGTICDIIK
ncbi:hypothetical protein ACJX0J_017837, partial [Zea mays]